ncbi:MAG: hypothetical protein CL458_07240, partial [Acidimicrobiaceae bacterium]|nr:hypothetical protein [Acidimicrobiaceae bacterium]
LRKVLERLDIQPPRRPITTNVTSRYYPTGEGAREEILETLAQQVAAPVEWIAQVERMYADGARIFVECGWRFACSPTNDVRDYRDIRIWVVAHPCIEGLASVIRIEVMDLLNGSVTYWDSTCRRLKEVSQAGRAAFTCSHNDSLEYSDKTVLATLSHYVPDRPDINLVKRIQTFRCLESYSYRKY